MALNLILRQLEQVAMELSVFAALYRQPALCSALTDLRALIEGHLAVGGPDTPPDGDGMDEPMPIDDDVPLDDNGSTNV
jgi:hypothetical protein